MKNFFKFLGIISMVLVIGFSMASCETEDDGDDSGGNTGGNTGGSGTARTITVTNIPAEHTGRFIRVVISEVTGVTGNLKGLANEADYSSSTAERSKAIAGTTVTLNVFDGNYKKYTGNATATVDKYDDGLGNMRPSVQIIISETDRGTSGKYANFNNNGAVTVTNGSATLDFSAFTQSYSNF